MFYRPKDGHGLQHSPFNAIITPRPIGWISTRSAGGTDNLAPYSFFNGISYTPPQVMFALTEVKDSLTNIRETGVFAVNVVSEALTDQMNISSENYDASVDEFVQAGLEKADCETINCARVAISPATLECEMTQVIQTKGDSNYVVMGEVTGVHMRDECVVNGRFDVSTFHPLSRLGYRDYSVVREVFELMRPDD